MVVVGAKDVQSDLLIVGDVEQSLVVKEGRHLVRVTTGQVGP